MKKIILCLMATCLSLTFLPLQSTAAATAATDSLVASRPLEARSLELRLNEANEMNKSKLKLADKKNLQQVEVRSERHNHYRSGSVVYVSAGSLLLIILLLVILF
jgi:hypothetical protein